MIFVIGILTVVLVLDCLLLILLVLVQLPKKDAGAGLAFGGGATDALFGAGSGNALTKITKYATVAFFVILMMISILQTMTHGGKTKGFLKAVEQQNTQLPPAAPAGPATTPAATTSSNAPAIQFLAPSNAAPPAAVPAATNAPAK
jgi:preprotein translocase subunit SecG